MNYEAGHILHQCHTLWCDLQTRLEEGGQVDKPSTKICFLWSYCSKGSSCLGITKQTSTHALEQPRPSLLQALAYSCVNIKEFDNGIPPLWTQDQLKLPRSHVVRPTKLRWLQQSKWIFNLVRSEKFYLQSNLNLLPSCNAECFISGSFLLEKDNFAIALGFNITQFGSQCHIHPSE